MAAIYGTQLTAGGAAVFAQQLGTGFSFSLSPSGLASSLALGAAAFSFASGSAFSLAATGEPSSLALGSPSLSLDLPVAFSLTPAGLTSTLASGLPTVDFTVPDTGEPVTLAEAKLAARVDGDELDTFISGAITAAREMAEQLTGQVYLRRTLRKMIADWPDDDEVFFVHRPTACAISYWAEDRQWAVLDEASFEYGDVGSWAGIAPALDSAWPTLGRRAIGPRVIVDWTAGPASRADVSEAVKLYIKATVSGWVNNGDFHTNQQLVANPLLAGLLDSERLWG